VLEQLELRRLLSERLEGRVMPLGTDVQAVRELADPDEAARGVESACRRLGCAGERGREIELAPELACDRGEQPFALQRLLEREARPQPLERDGRLRGERLHHREILVREDPRLVERRNRDHRGHPLLYEQRDERGALRSHRGDEAAADDAGGLRVVDGEGRRLEDRARDPRWLALEVEAQLAPPVEVLPERAGETPGRLAPIVGDEGESDEADVEKRCELIEQRPRDALDVRAPCELVGDAADALELPAGRTAGVARAGTAANRRQERHCGRSAAECANGRGLDCDPHWGDRLYGARYSGAKTAPGRGKARRSGGRCGGLSRLLPASVRDAAVRIAQ
jgi:hypothetical protein